MGIEAEIEAAYLGSALAEHQLDKFAEQICDEIKALTPVFRDHDPKRDEPGIGEPGDLKESIKVSPIKWPNKRRVGSEDPKVIWAELGAKHFPEVGMFAQVVGRHGGTGPIIDEGIQHAQHHLRGELKKLQGLTDPVAIAAQETAIQNARLARSAAFKAARGPRRRR